MVKLLSFKCNKCNDILYKTGECHCKELKLIRTCRFYNLYTEDEDYQIIWVYKDNDMVVKIVDTQFKDLGLQYFYDIQKEKI